VVYQMRRRPMLLLVLLVMVWVWASAFVTPLPSAAQDNPTPLPSPLPATPNGPSPEAILAAANRASADATNAVSFVNTLMSFIQVAAVLGGVLVAIASAALSVTGIRTLRSYRAELDSARSELNKMRDDLRGETARAAEMLQGFDARISDGLLNVRTQADKAIRALVLLQLADQQMEMRNMKAAQQTLLEAYQDDPNNRATNYLLGDLYLQQRDMQKGIEHFEQTKNEAGEYYPPAEAGLAYALRVQGDKHPDISEKNRLYAKAEMHFIESLRKDPTMRDINGESFYGALGGLYRRQGRLADAIRCYLQAEKVTPYNGYPVNNLALLYFMQGNVSESARYFARSKQLSERGLETQPGDYWLRINIITALIALNDTDAALHQLEMVIDLLPGVGHRQTSHG
jgi:tetratricopeptide (TPR) repeat protein